MPDGGRHDRPARTAPLVLIIDDEADIRDMLRQILERKGYRIALAGSASGALASLSRDDPPRLILADIMMPGMALADFRERLRGDATFAAVPILVLSGDPTAGAQAVAMGASGHLMKPLELASLLAEVRRHCTPPEAAAE